MTEAQDPHGDTPRAPFQTERVAAFVDAVVGRVGMERFNAVWTSPETLPRRPDLADPDRWIARVL